jgi:protein TonB
VSTHSTRPRPVATVVAVSVALHGAAFAAVSQMPPPPERERIEIEVVRRARPVEPPPRAEPAPEAEAPLPARRAVALAARPATPAEPPPSSPPSLAPAAEAAPSPAPRALPRVGVSLASTVAAGGFAVGVGNTAYGRAAETAAAPESVRRGAGAVVAAARLSAQPKVIDLPEIEYPADARRSGVEGQVVLVLRIDAQGAVAGVRVVDAPTPELAEAARTGARRFRFSPALLDGEPVETEIRFTYTFLLE